MNKIVSFAMLIAVLIVLASCSTPAPTRAPMAVPPTSLRQPTDALAAIQAPIGQSYTNSLGMKFVPVPGTSVLFCIWETRVRDWAAYASANSGVDRSCEHLTFLGVPVNDGSDHPILRINWSEAQAFCEWLTRKEQSAGLIRPSQSYRLPTDLEWSTAVGLPSESGITPKERDKKVQNVYPWGSQWPPPSDAGNYADRSGQSKFSGWTGIRGYDDGYAATAPVGSFAANRYGIYDLGGNVWEWCEDFYDGKSGAHVLRGASWMDRSNVDLLSSSRFALLPNVGYAAAGFRCVLTSMSPEQQKASSK